MKQFHRKSVQLAIIVVVTLLAYSNIFSNEFLIDDHAFITNWEKVRSLTSIPDLLKGAVPPVHEGVYRPIRSVLYAVYYSLFGTNPWGWHLHSLLVHLAATVLVYFIVSRILEVGTSLPAPLRPASPNRGEREASGKAGKLDLESSKSRILDVKKSIRQLTDQAQEHLTSNFKNSVPFIAALLFGLHPIHTESITYIAASMEMTGAVFFFASFYWYLRGIGESGGIREKVLSLVFALLAFFTYEMTLTLPVLILLHNVILDRNVILSEAKNLRKRSFAATLLRMTKESIPYFTLAGLYVFIRQVIIHVPASRGEYLAYSFYHTQLTMVKVYVKYIQLLIAPYNVSYLHELTPGFFSWMTKYDKLESILAQSIFDWDILLAITVITFITIIMVIARKRAPLVTFAIAWFFIALLPVSYIVPQGIALAEKYLYIASFGYVLLITQLIFNFQFSIFNQISMFKNSNNENSMKIKNLTLMILVASVATGYGYLTFQRSRDWHDPVSFWGKAVVQQPKSPLAHYNVALAYGEKNDIEKAAFHYQQAVLIEPTFWEARFNLANIYLRTGQIDLAVKEYKTVLLLNPEFPAAQENLRFIEKEIRQRDV